MTQRPGDRQREPIIKLVQYLSGLTTGQDIWSEAGHAVHRYLGVDVVAFAERTADGEINIHHLHTADSHRGTRWFTTLADAATAGDNGGDVASGLHEAITETLESGVLSTRLWSAPTPLSVAFSPIFQENRVTTVLLIGLRSSERLPGELLDISLTVAGLIGTTGARLASERELFRHRQHREAPVEATTTERGKTSVCFQREISRRECVEQQLARAVDEWQMTFDASADAIWVIDEEQRILRCNAASMRMFPLPPGQTMEGRHCWEVFHGTGQSIPECPMVRAKQSLRRETTELRIGDGWHQITVDPIINSTGEVSGSVHVVSDITKRKHAEEAKRKFEEQIVSSQRIDAIGRLAGGVAHDFNNKLGVIISCTELILMDTEPDDPRRIELREIDQAARHSAELTRQLLAFASRQVISPRVLALNEALRGMLPMLHRLIGENVDLVWQPAADLWPVCMDPGQVDQILASLCDNARDAVPGAGTVTIETRNRVLGEADCAAQPGSSPGAYVVLAVSDNGGGMDAATLSRIFEPFFTTKDGEEGSGLGLATVYGIVRQNHGFISVDSKPGQGTTFKIFLPRHTGEGAEQSPATELEEAAPGRKETVLLAEDEVSLLRAATKVLEKLGYTVLPASSGEQALEIAESHGEEIALLITDIEMPEMSGKVLADRLAEVLPDVKVLFISGYTAATIAHHGVHDGQVHFLQKPFSMQDLSSCVRRALDDPR